MILQHSEQCDAHLIVVKVTRASTSQGVELTMKAKSGRLRGCARPSLVASSERLSAWAHVAGAWQKAQSRESTDITFVGQIARVLEHSG